LVRCNTAALQSRDWTRPRRAWRTPCSAESQEAQRPVVKSVAPPRQAAPPPQPLPVEHSAAYLLRHRNPVQSPVASRSRDAADDEDADQIAGNAVERALRRLDRSLDELEDNPPPLAETLWAVSNSPVGTATSKGISTAAKVGKEAVMLAIPAGKWALTQGLKVAVGAVVSANASKKPRKKVRKEAAPRTSQDESL